MDCSDGSAVADAIGLTDVSGEAGPTTHTVECQVYMNYIVAKSKIPGVASKIVKIQSYGAPMTEAQKAEVLGRMAQKMREEAAALAAAAAADVSGGVISDVSAGSAE